MKENASTLKRMGNWLSNVIKLSKQTNKKQQDATMLSKTKKSPFSIRKYHKKPIIMVCPSLSSKEWLMQSSKLFGGLYIAFILTLIYLRS